MANLNDLRCSADEKVCKLFRLISNPNKSLSSKQAFFEGKDYESF